MSNQIRLTPREREGAIKTCTAIKKESIAIRHNAEQQLIEQARIPTFKRPTSWRGYVEGLITRIEFESVVVTRMEGEITRLNLEQ